jgi:hypothetical protein
MNRNTANRGMTLKGAVRCVLAYAAAMERGEWVLNGETVVISNTGDLNDGQHRLAAVLRACQANPQLTVPMLLVFGVERETRHTIDQGVGRSNAHILAMYGEHNTTNLASALQFVWAMVNGYSLHRRPSTDELLDTLKDHPDLRAAVKEAWGLAGVFRVSLGYIGATQYLCARVDADKAEAFLHMVKSGVDVPSQVHPVAKLRHMYIEHYAKRERMRALEQTANYIRAFNAFCQDRSRFTTWKDNGVEDFPQPGV